MFKSFVAYLVDECMVAPIGVVVGLVLVLNFVN